MNYITQEEAMKLYIAAEEEAPKLLGCVGKYHPDLWKVEHRLLCNAAIKHYLDAQPAKPVEPEGFVLVPTKLTEAMEDAAMGYVYQHGFTRGDGPAAVYKAMLAAAAKERT